MTNVDAFYFSQLGMIVDLTNTDRYYSSSDFKKEGIKYLKVPINFLLTVSLDYTISLD